MLSKQIATVFHNDIEVEKLGFITIVLSFFSMFNLGFKMVFRYLCFILFIRILEQEMPTSISGGNVLQLTK